MVKKLHIFANERHLYFLSIEENNSIKSSANTVSHIENLPVKGLRRPVVFGMLGKVLMPTCG